METMTEHPVEVDFSVYEGAVELTRHILDQIFTDGLNTDYNVRLWNKEVFTPWPVNRPRFTLVLNHPGARRRMFFPPGEITLGEAYLHGDFDIEGDMVAASAIVESFEHLRPMAWLGIARKVLSLPVTKPNQAFVRGRRRLNPVGTRHSIARDRETVPYHYDTGNDFFRLILGKWMTNSYAYFEGAETDLDTAQEAKLEHICRRLRLREGERLLDIGCGWDGLVLYAARRYGAHAFGITLSEPQTAYSRSWIQPFELAERARVEVRDYRELRSLEPFDKIVSVGMFEHVGRKNQTAYFETA